MGSGGSLRGKDSETASGQHLKRELETHDARVALKGADVVTMTCPRVLRSNRDVTVTRQQLIGWEA